MSKLSCRMTKMSYPGSLRTFWSLYCTILPLHAAKRDLPNLFSGGRPLNIIKCSSRKLSKYLGKEKGGSFNLLTQLSIISKAFHLIKNVTKYSNTSFWDSKCLSFSKTMRHVDSALREFSPHTVLSPQRHCLKHKCPFITEAAINSLSFWSMYIAAVPTI